MAFPDHIAQMIAYYDRRAPWHDAHMNVRSPEQFAEYMAPIVELLRPKLRHAHVLELACGTGNWTCLLAALCHVVIAVDSSPESLRLARAKLIGVKNVRLELRDVYQLPISTYDVDLVFAADLYSHIPRGMTETFFKSVQRAVREPAEIVLVDMLEPHVFASEFAGLDSTGDRLYERTLPDGSTHTVIKNFPTEDELRQAVRGVADGFVYQEFSSLQRWSMAARLVK